MFERIFENFLAKSLFFNSVYKFDKIFGHDFSQIFSENSKICKLMCMQNLHEKLKYFWDEFSGIFLPSYYFVNSRFKFFGAKCQTNESIS